jgi:predicted secreted protein
MPDHVKLTVVTAVAFDVELASAPSTGYMWELFELPRGVRLLGSEFRQRPSAAVGDPGVEVFHLIADEPGQFSLNFDLKRRWESEAVQSQIVDVTSQ